MKRIAKIINLYSLLMVAGLLCILYCISVYFVGFGTKFFLVWGMIGTVLIVGSFLQWKWKLFSKLPRWMKRICGIVLCVGVVLFLLIEGLIFSQFHAQASAGADYCIILGAQWKTYGPSNVLQRRLDKAIEYLNANPETRVIVSGGQGGNEPITEASGMRQYLIDHGIAAERILMEDKSRNTDENLRFSAAFVDLKEDRVVIVTNNFHVYRAVKIAKKKGYRAEGLAATSLPALLPNNLLREFLGVLKDFLVGNL